jgi:hypothetical protein
MVLTKPKYDMTVEELGKLAIEWAQSTNDPIDPEYAAVEAKACTDLANIKLTTAEQEIRSRQIELSREANSLSEKLLHSNQQASVQSEKTAKSMSKATEQLAESTHSLNRATWVLVGVTAVQALTAIVALYISLSSHK